MTAALGRVDGARPEFLRYLISLRLPPAGCIVVFEFRILGAVDLRNGDDDPVRSVLAQRKRVALLAHLALAAPGSLRSRDTLLALFWPEYDSHRARKSLNQAVYYLRRSLGPETVVTRGEELGVDRERLWCDAAAFQAALEEGRLEEALEHYRGELLEGFHVDGCPAFERWLHAERRELTERAVVACRRLGATHVTGDHPVEAVRWLRRAAQLAPYDEGVCRELMEGLVRAGDRTGAVRAYEAFEARVTDELQIAPSEELAERAAALAQGAVRESAPAREPPVDPGSPTAPSQGMLFGYWRRVAVLALLLLGAAGLIHFTGSGGEAERAGVGGQGWADARVVVLPFGNETGDPDLDPLGLMAADWIGNRLARTGMMRVVPVAALPPSVLDRSRRMPDPQDTDTSGEGMVRPAALADQLDARFVVTGTYYRQADSVIMRARITDHASGDRLRRVDAVSVRPGDAIEGVELLGQRVTGALATALDLRMERWSAGASLPSSFEAYSRYAAGIDLFVTSDWGAAARQFHRAALVDSTFTAPLVWAALAHQYAQEVAEAEALVTHLEGRLDELALWDRTMLRFVASNLQANPTGSYHAARELARIAPNSEWVYLLVVAALHVNRPWEAIEHLTSIDPDRGWLGDQATYWRTLGHAHHRIGEYEEELRTFEELRGRRPELAPFGRFWPLVGLGRIPEVFELLQHLVTTREPSGSWGTLRLTTRLVYELSTHGYPNEADRAALEILEWGEAATPEVRGGLFHRAQRARLLLHLGRDAEARALLEELEVEDPTVWGFQGRLAILAARRGDREEALRRSRKIEEEWAGRHHGEATLWRASIAAHLGDLPVAMDLVRRAFADGLNHSIEHHFRPDLAPLRSYPPFQELFRPQR